MYFKNSGIFQLFLATRISGFKLRTSGDNETVARRTPGKTDVWGELAIDRIVPIF